MSRDALDRMAAVDPVPASARPPSDLWSTTALLDVLDERSHAVSVSQLETKPPRPQPPQRSRWLVAAAAFAVVIAVVAVAVLINNRGSGNDVIDEPSSTTTVVSVGDPRPVVEAFFEAWNERDAAAAQALTTPDMTVNGRSASDEHFYEYVIAWGGTFAVDCAAPDDASVTCALSFDAPPLEHFDGPLQAETRFEVRDGLLAAIDPFLDASSIERQLYGYAQAADRARLEDYCGDGEGTRSPLTNVLHNRRCGAYIAFIAESYRADRDALEIAKQSVADYFDAWNRGDFEAAAALHSDHLRINGRDVASPHFLEFFHAFGARHDVSCSGHSAELACAWRWVPAHIIGPLGDQKVTPSVIVVGQGLGFETAGVIESINGMPGSTAADRALVEFAGARDPQGFAAACATGPGHVSPASGARWNRACGEFLAAQAAAFGESR